MDDEDIELSPPTASDVARRATILKFLFVCVAATPPREEMERLAASWSQSDRESFEKTLESKRVEIVDGLRLRGLWKDTSASERAIFEAPPHRLTSQQHANVSWRAESIVCLAWALRLVDRIPAYDSQADPGEAYRAIPWESAEQAALTLRPSAEIEQSRDVAELWHWRSRTRQLAGERNGKQAANEKYDPIVRKASQRAAADGIISPPIGGDFPAFGLAYRDLSAEQWACVQSIAMERHLALNWLCGFAPANKWDETPTDT
jgi:hypothetical protein